MVITTHQPIFLPWPGFFYKALQADVMILLDGVQFPLGRSWITRNRLKCDKGEMWLRVPVWRKRLGKQIICSVKICDETDWRTKHIRTLRHQYANAPYLPDLLPALEEIYSRAHPLLAGFNVDLIRLLWRTLGLKTQLILQSGLAIAGTGTDLLISICRALNADTYVTLPPVKKYLDPEKFTTSGIRLNFVPFHPPIYPQLWRDFRFNLSLVDLLMNCGPKALRIIAHPRSADIS